MRFTRLCGSVRACVTQYDYSAMRDVDSCVGSLPGSPPPFAAEVPVDPEPEPPLTPTHLPDPRDDVPESARSYCFECCAPILEVSLMMCNYI